MPLGAVKRIVYGIDGARVTDARNTMNQGRREELIRRLDMIFGGGILGLIILVVVVMFVVRSL
jgi:hypothetical protein